MNKKPNSSSGEKWELITSVVYHIPSHREQVRKLVTIISAAVALTCTSVGGYAWYVEQKNEEEAAKALLNKKRALAALQTEQKKPKKLTEAEKNFAYNSKQLTVNENGEIALYTTFSKPKDLEKKPPSTEKLANKAQVHTPAPTPTASKKVPETKAPEKTDPPPPKIIQDDGRIILTGKPGETEELAKLLRSAWDPTAQKKSRK